MSDTDSESEFSDHRSEKPILVKPSPSGQSPIEYRSVPGRQRKRRQSQKNNFQGTHRRRKCIVCLGGFVFLILIGLAVVLVINHNNKLYYNYEYNNNSKHIVNEINSRINVLVLNWHTNEVSQFSSNCTVTFANTSQTQNMTILDYYSNNVIILNSTVQNILDDKDLFLSPNPNQLVIFATNKPLQYHLHTKISATDANWLFSSFQKTLSYSLQSDFHWPTYRIFRYNDNKFVAPSMQPQWLGAETDQFLNIVTRNISYNSVRESSPLALSILSSPCQVVRNELIDRMAEYIEVHKYGECGEFE